MVSCGGSNFSLAAKLSASLCVLNTTCTIELYGFLHNVQSACPVRLLGSSDTYWCGASVSVAVMISQSSIESKSGHSLALFQPRGLLARITVLIALDSPHPFAQYTITPSGSVVTLQLEQFEQCTALFFGDHCSSTSSSISVFIISITQPLSPYNLYGIDSVQRVLVRLPRVWCGSHA